MELASLPTSFSNAERNRMLIKAIPIAKLANCFISSRKPNSNMEISDLLTIRFTIFIKYIIRIPRNTSFMRCQGFEVFIKSTAVRRRFSMSGLIRRSLIVFIKPSIMLLDTMAIYEMKTTAIKSIKFFTVLFSIFQKFLDLCVITSAVQFHPSSFCHPHQFKGIFRNVYAQTSNLLDPKPGLTQKGNYPFNLFIICSIR